MWAGAARGEVGPGKARRLQARLHPGRIGTKPPWTDSQGEHCTRGSDSGPAPQQGRYSPLKDKAHDHQGQSQGQGGQHVPRVGID